MSAHQWRNWKTSMGKKRKSHINPHDILIGYSGKLECDNRLSHHIRMTKKYRAALQLEELDKSEMMLQMSTLIQKYKSLSSVIISLMRENCNGANANLIMELDEELRRYKNGIWYSGSKLDYQLTDDLNKSMNEIFDWDGPRSKPCSNRSCEPKKNYEHLPVYKSTRISLPIETSSKTYNHTSRSSQFASVKSQILVRDNCSQLQTIRIDLFSNGSNLFDVLASERGDDANCYDITFGTNKVDKKNTLWAQEIYHGCTVDLNIRLQGGMGKKKKKNKSGVQPADASFKEKSINPELWTKSQVIQWFKYTSKEYEIDEKDISSLMILNGKGLNELEKTDWIRRSPNQGDLMHSLWKKVNAQHLKKESDSQLVKESDSQKVTDDTTSNLQIEEKEAEETAKEVTSR